MDSEAQVRSPAHDAKGQRPMSIRPTFIPTVVAGLALAAGLLAAPPAAQAGVTHHVVRGRMDPVATDGAEHGRYRMMVADRSNGAHVERIEAFARNLDVTPTASNTPPDYHVFLVK